MNSWRIYRYVVRVFQSATGRVLFGYVWRLGGTLSVILGVAGAIERSYAQFDRGYQASWPLFIAVAFVALLLAGLTVYLNMVSVQRNELCDLKSASDAQQAQLRDKVTAAQTAHRAIAKAYADLEVEIKIERDRKPNIIFGLARDRKGKVETSSTIWLPYPPQQFDVDARLSEHLGEVQHELNRLPSERDLDLGGIIVVGRVLNPNYAAEAAEYPNRYREYLERLQRFNLARTGWLVELRPRAVNLGQMTAESVTFVLHFPDTIRPADFDERWWWDDRFNEPPYPPGRPLRSVSLLSTPPRVGSFDPSTLSMSDASDIAGPFIEDTGNQAAAVYKVPQIVHGGLEVVFDPLLVWFGGLRESRMVEIQVETFTKSDPSSAPKQSTLRLDCRILAPADTLEE